VASNTQNSLSITNQVVVLEIPTRESTVHGVNERTQAVLDIKYSESGVSPERLETNNQ